MKVSGGILERRTAVKYSVFKSTPTWRPGTSRENVLQIFWGSFKFNGSRRPFEFNFKFESSHSKDFQVWSFKPRTADRVWLMIAKCKHFCFLFFDSDWIQTHLGWICHSFAWRQPSLSLALHVPWLSMIARLKIFCQRTHVGSKEISKFAGIRLKSQGRLSEMGRSSLRSQLLFLDFNILFLLDCWCTGWVVIVSD